MNQRSTVSVLAMWALVACSASNEAGSTASGGSGTSAGGSSGGTGAQPSNTGSPSAGNANVTLRVDDAGMADSGDVQNGVCSNQSFNLQRKPAEILILLDRSESMNHAPDGAASGSLTKWQQVSPALNAVVASTATSIQWGLKLFPEGTGKACVAGSVTSAIPVPIAALNAAPVATEIMTATPPLGNGTPTGDAVNAATAYLKTLTDQNPKFILLATDGDPSCAGTSSDSNTSHTFAVQAVTDAATAGFKTFVVGVATTSKSSTKTLNQMAVAGQMPRSDPTTQFYLATTEDELATALQTITGQVASCVFDLTAVPPDPDNIAVHVNNTKAPRDKTKTNGWDYTGTDEKQVQVYGSWCDQIKAADANTVNFVFGCVGQPPPA